MSTFQKLRKEERETRKNLIIDAAKTVFGTKTYDKVSMQEIANAAGIAKSSIYTYFKNQEALFVEAAYRDTQRFIGELETRLQGKDEAQKLEALTRCRTISYMRLVRMKAQFVPFEPLRQNLHDPLRIRFVLKTNNEIIGPSNEKASAF